LLEIDHFLKKIVQSSDFCPHRFEISAKSCKVAILAHNLPSRLHGIAGCRPAHLMLPIRAGFGRLASFVAGRRTLCLSIRAGFGRLAGGCCILPHSPGCKSSDSV